jgi:hypothetical protein
MIGVLGDRPVSVIGVRVARGGGVNAAFGRHAAAEERRYHSNGRGPAAPGRAQRRLVHDVTAIDATFAERPARLREE